jgi:hypothetical protein
MNGPQDTDDACEDTDDACEDTDDACATVYRAMQSIFNCKRLLGVARCRRFLRFLHLHDTCVRICAVYTYLA